MAILKVNRGTTYTIDFQYQKNGVPTTLVGATVRFTVKPTEYDDNTTDSGAAVLKNITNGDSLGTAVIKISPTDTAVVEPGNYYYDIKVQEAGGDIYKVDEGKLVLDGSPTNRLS